MDDSEYMDITKELFGSLKSIKNKKVIQSEYFDLLEGARAVEVTNEKLDTGLVLSRLTEPELKFDCYKEISGNELIAINNKLLKLFMSWLNNSSLPLTVLSCRYVQELVSIYSQQVDKSGITTKLTLGNGIFNQILTGVVIGISKIIGVLITIGNTVLYEEEDLTTRTMDLNFLNEILIDEVLELLEQSIYVINNVAELLGQISSEEKHILTSQLKLLINLNKLPILFNISIDLFNHNLANLNQIGFFNDILNQGRESIEQLLKFESHIESCDPPQGSFSRYIQGKLNNRNIPGEIFEIEFGNAFNQMKQIFTDVQSVFNDLTRLLTVPDLEMYLQYDIQIPAAKFNVVTRGLFQLYLIRDDQSIFGSSINLGLLTREIMDEYNLLNCNIMNKLTWSLSASDTNIVEAQLDQLIKDVEVAMYQNLIIPGNNRCRQRQLINKNLMIWENLSIASNQFELMLYQKYKIFDREEPYFVISEFINYTKLRLMIDYLLIGIELDLYKSFEIYSVYWYLCFLLDQMMKQLTDDIEFNKFKLSKLRAIMKKKKFKNPQQKLEMTDKRDKLVQIINNNENTLKHYQIFSQLAGTTKRLLMYYHQSQDMKEIDFTKAPENFIVTLEKLYYLRFKAFEGIHNPQLLKFDQYLVSINDAEMVKVEDLIELFNEAKTSLTEMSQSINHNGYKNWSSGLIKSCVLYVLQLKSPGKKFQILPGYNSYFPRFIES